MAGSIRDYPLVHIRLRTDPPMKGAEFYWGKWETTTDFAFFELLPIPEGTKVLGIEFKYVPAPTAEEIERQKQMLAALDA